MLKYIFIISILLALGETPSALCAETEEETFKYDDMGARDPFVPLVDKDGKLTVVHGSIDTVKDIVVEGILYDSEGESVVILNGLVLNEGDQVGNITVERIFEHRVILSAKGKEYTLKLKE